MSVVIEQQAATSGQEGKAATLLLIALCCSIFFVDPLVTELRMLPHAFSWLPELVAGAATVLSLMYLARSGRLMIRPAYIALFLAFVALLIAGWLFNDVQGLTVVAGIRVYFRYVPLFFLPMVLAISDVELRTQLKFVGAILIFQLPMVVLQKWVLGYPPDHITGTAMISSALSFLLISGLGLVAAMYFKGQLSPSRAALLALLLFFPTTINETKGTLVLMPISLATAFLLARKDTDRQISIGTAIGPMFALTGLFFLMYSFTVQDYWVADDAEESEGLIEFFSDPDRGILRYLSSGDAHLVNAEALLGDNPASVLGANSDPGIVDSRMRRLDSTILPYYLLKQRPTRLVVGLGAGNTSEFSIGSASGRYEHIWSYIGATVSATTISLELGYAGLLVFVLFLLLIFQDSVRLSRTKGLDSALGCWWAGIVLMFLVALIYKDFIKFNTIGFLFWYFSGLIVSRSYLSQLKSRAQLISRSRTTNFSIPSQTPVGSR